MGYMLKYLCEIYYLKTFNFSSLTASRRPPMQHPIRGNDMSTWSVTFIFDGQLMKEYIPLALMAWLSCANSSGRAISRSVSLNA